ncbi:hypothetical protein XFF6166_20008 [Xanthomonas citri pv. fuscans]|nr:hypothetical protein XFF6166_20008 [Xanthomonas citri pv. fuscans]SON99154.1 hypothetical protein XFF6960_130056 [Xanthomonas citri pv. fuscans]SOO05603.1 hypothetical protein XFF7767_450057 [Xanthomonas citri pv. fuscans]SOO08854.1 hypothetical protein XFF6970_30008 [Xanthomonas citri pv. fuscans]SOO15221.1 hypothetical protein XFF7766_510008 [Xanthomonas citri pv. fuscans]
MLKISFGNENSLSIQRPHESANHRAVVSLARTARSSRGGHVVSSQQVQALHPAAQCQLGVFRHRASDRAGLVAARAVLAGDGTNAREARAHSSTRQGQPMPAAIAIAEGAIAPDLGASPSWPVTWRPARFHAGTLLCPIRLSKRPQPKSTS